MYIEGMAQGRGRVAGIVRQACGVSLGRYKGKIRRRGKVVGWEQGAGGGVRAGIPKPMGVGSKGTGI